MNLDSTYDFDFEHLHYFFKYFQTVAIQTIIIRTDNFPNKTIILLQMLTNARKKYLEKRD